MLSLLARAKLLSVGYVLMLAWNAVIPALTGLIALTFWQAVALNLIVVAVFPKMRANKD